MSDPQYVADFLKALKEWPPGWPPPECIEIGEYEYRGPSRISMGARDVASDKKAETSPGVSLEPTLNAIPWKPLEHTNPLWTKDAKDALEWLYNHQRRTGKKWPELAAKIGVGEKWLPKYFRRNPPNPQDDQVNAILRLKADTEAQP